MRGAWPLVLLFLNFSLTVFAQTSVPSSSRPTTRLPTTLQPTRQPSSQPTNLPTKQPTSRPTTAPTAAPSRLPTSQPSLPTSRPSLPTSQPSLPTSQPSRVPSQRPTASPVTRSPSGQPTLVPSLAPSRQPTRTPSRTPSSLPTTATPSTSRPTVRPSSRPTFAPTKAPSLRPTVPTTKPSNTPTPASSPIPVFFTLSIAFQAPLTAPEFRDVQVALCDTAARFSEVNVSDVNCTFARLAGSVYMFTMQGIFDASGLTVPRFSTDISLALTLQRANDGALVRESDFNVTIPPTPGGNTAANFFQTQQLFLIICGGALVCCLILCIVCGISGRRNSGKTSRRMAATETEMPSSTRRHLRPSGGSSSSDKPLGPNAASSSRSTTQHSGTHPKLYREHFHSLDSTSSRPSFSSIVPPPALLPSQDRGSDTAVPPSGQLRNHSFSSFLEAMDPEDSDMKYDTEEVFRRLSNGSLPPPPDFGFTPLASLPEHHSTRDGAAENGGSRRGLPVSRYEEEMKHNAGPPLNTDDEEETGSLPPPPPPLQTTLSTPTRSSLSARFSASLPPLAVNILPPSPHPYNNFSPQPFYQFNPSFSPASSPSASQQPSSPSHFTSVSFRPPISTMKHVPVDTNSSIPTHTDGDFEDVVPSRRVFKHTKPLPTAPSPRKTLTRHSLEGTKHASDTAPSRSRLVPAFSQGVAELKFAPLEIPRKRFTTSDEDRAADHDVPSLSGGSAKFESSYKGNPLWDAATASIDTRNR